jgi:hypothetical protein
MLSVTPWTDGSAAGGGRFVVHRGVFFATAVLMVVIATVARSPAARANVDAICKKKGSEF